MDLIDKLLARQLKRCRRPDGSLDQDKFISSVEDAYRYMDRERRLVDNSLALMSKELLEANQQLRDRHTDRIQELSLSLYNRSGTDYLESLIKQLSQILDKEVGIIALWDSETDEFCPVAACTDGELQELPRYAVKGTPCEKVLSENSYSVLSGVAEKFPDSPFLQGSDFNSYVGVSLRSPELSTIGVICLLGKAPLSDDTEARSLLRIVASRAEMEIEYQRRQNELRVSNHELETLIECLPLCLIVKDAANDYRYARVNTEFEKTFGAASAAVIGKTDFELHPQKLAECYREGDLRAGKCKDKLIIDEEDIATVNGTRIARAVKYALRDNDGQVTHIVVLLQDITDLKEALKIAEDASKSKSEFLANMSHEIRTPMNGVLGMLDLAMETVLSDAQKDFLDTANTSAKSLLRIIDDILDFSKIEARKLEICSERYDLQHLVDTTSRTIDVLASKRNISFVKVVTEQVPSHCVGDQDRVKQVLMNLLGNALKFTPEGGSVLLQVNTILQPERQPILRFSITDSGDGIPADKREKIFDAFKQIDMSSTRKHGGVGLGLAIAKELAQLMGGDISVHSIEDCGSAFILELPLIESKPVALVADAQRETELQEARKGRLGSYRILLVEDNLINQKVVKTMLEKAGQEVLIAADGQAAVNTFAEHRFDIVLMDIQLPVLSGVEATAKIRELPRGADTPIVALTAHAMAGDKEKYISSGMDDYLSKPIDRKALLAMLLKHCGRSVFEA